MSSRIRSIKPEILDDEEAAALSDAAWRLWVSMWTLADDFGNLRASEKFLAGRVWQDTARSVAATLDELVKAKRITLYQDSSGHTYASIRNWSKHQRIDNAGKPKVPSSTAADCRQLSPTFAETRRESVSDPLPIAAGLEGKGKEEDKAESRTAEIREVWDHFVSGWRRVIGAGREPVLSPERRRMIRARLNGGFGVAELRKACDGLWASDFNIENGHTSAELIFRNGGQVEKYMAKAPAAPKPAAASLFVEPKTEEPWTQLLEAK